MIQLRVFTTKTYGHILLGHSVQVNIKRVCASSIRLYARYFYHLWSSYLTFHSKTCFVSASPHWLICAACDLDFLDLLTFKQVASLTWYVSGHFVVFLLAFHSRVKSAWHGTDWQTDDAMRNTACWSDGSITVWLRAGKSPGSFGKKFVGF